MPFPDKLMNLSALLAKLETPSYGTSMAPLAAATDGQLLDLNDRHQGLFSLGYLFDGRLGPSPGNMGDLPTVGMLGRKVTGEAPMRPKGSGAAYSASVLPNIHLMRLISGFDHTVVTTPGSESVTYRLTADGLAYKSATAEYFKRGEKWTAVGMLANWKSVFENMAPAMDLFDTRAICTAEIVDAAMVAPTYPALAVRPPANVGMVVTIGSYLTARVLRAEYNTNRTIDTERMSLTAADGHLGFVPSGVSPEIRMTIEAPPIVAGPFHTSAGLDPYNLAKSANVLAVSIKQGSVQYNRRTIAMPTAQLVDFTPSNDGPKATLDLVFRGHASTPVLQQDLLTETWD